MEGHYKAGSEVHGFVLIRIKKQGSSYMCVKEWKKLLQGTLINGPSVNRIYIDRKMNRIILFY